MNYEILDNAFWEDGIDDRSVVKCIRMHDEPNGGKRKEVATFSKFLPDRSLCPKYKEVVAVVGEQRIDENTEERRKRKSSEKKNNQIKQEQAKKTKQLEDLFHAKLMAFEIPEIKDSPDKALRSKLRRSENIFEMNAYATLIIGKAHGLFKDE